MKLLEKILHRIVFVLSLLFIFVFLIIQMLYLNSITK
jgi:preprotein translocase subunit SecG